MHCIKKCYQRNLEEWLPGRPLDDPEGVAVCGESTELLHLDVLNGAFELLPVYFWSSSVEAVRNRAVCEQQDLPIITISETVTLWKRRRDTIQHHARRKDKKAPVCCMCFSSLVLVLKHINFSQHLLALAGTDAFQLLSTQSVFFGIYYFELY